MIVAGIEFPPAVIVQWLRTGANTGNITCAMTSWLNAYWNVNYFYVKEIHLDFSWLLVHSEFVYYNENHFIYIVVYTTFAYISPSLTSSL